MNVLTLVLGAALCTQTLPAPGTAPGGSAITSPTLPATTAPVPVAPAPASALSATATTPAPVAPATSVVPSATAASGPIAPEDVQDPSTVAPNFTPPVGYVPQATPIGDQARGLFESDHAFDGFTTPLSNPVQSKDPRSLTEVRFLFLGDWSRPSTPVIGGGAFQVYAMQVRLGGHGSVAIVRRQGRPGPVLSQGCQLRVRPWPTSWQVPSMC